MSKSPEEDRFIEVYSLHCDEKQDYLRLDVQFIVHYNIYYLFGILGPGHLDLWSMRIECVMG